MALTPIQIVAGHLKRGGETYASYPVNLIAVIGDTGVSNAYLKPFPGIKEVFDYGSGAEKGGVIFQGEHYRLIGSTILKQSAADDWTVCGAITEAGADVKFAYSFDRLAVATGNCLYYWNNATLTKVTDTDLGQVLDVIWIDGYFVTTDGSYIVVTDLADPTSVNPLKYGGSEADPDPIVALHKINNELVALNRYTTETFYNAGTAGFPFSRVQGSIVQKGAIWRKATLTYNDALFFVGSGKNEPLALYALQNSAPTKISSPYIDSLLSRYRDIPVQNALWGDITLESLTVGSVDYLVLHLHDRTLLCNLTAGKILDNSFLWTELVSGVSNYARYNARNFVLFEGTYYCGQGSKLGVLTTDVATQWEQATRWEFRSPYYNNKGVSSIFNSFMFNLEATNAGTFSISFSNNGIDWNRTRPIFVSLTAVKNGLFRAFGFGLMQNKTIIRIFGDTNFQPIFQSFAAEIEETIW